jgi:hypothetical protein
MTRLIIIQLLSAAWSATAVAVPDPDPAVENLAAEGWSPIEHLVLVKQVAALPPPNICGYLYGDGSMFFLFEWKKKGTDLWNR